MRIRLIRKNDLASVSVLNEKAIPHVNSLTLDELEWFMKKSQLFVVAEEENTVVGYMIVLGPGIEYESLNYKYFVAHYKSFDYVDRIVVADSHKGKGIGTALYKYLNDNSTSKFVTCEVNLIPPNPLSIKFHENKGFKEVARQKSEGGKKMVSLRVKNLEENISKSTR